MKESFPYVHETLSFTLTNTARVFTYTIKKGVHGADSSHTRTKNIHLVQPACITSIGAILS